MEILYRDASARKLIGVRPRHLYSLYFSSIVQTTVIHMSDTDPRINSRNSFADEIANNYTVHY